MQRRAESLAAEIFIGGPVKDFDEVGRLQLAVLLQEGAQPTSKVLDVGCGALRAGYWLLHFLEPGCYFGIEPNQKMLYAGIECLLEPGLLDRAQPTFSSAEDFDFTAFGTTFDFVLARSIWTHASKAQICSMLGSFARTASPAGVFLTSYRPANLTARGTRRWPVAERLAGRWALAAQVPSLAPLLPSVGAAMWDYGGAEWVGQSHEPSLPGMIHHSFGWIAHEWARRGLRARELGYGVVNHQRWLRIERCSAG